MAVTFEDFENGLGDWYNVDSNLTTSNSRSQSGSYSAYFPDYGDGTSLADRDLFSGGAAVDWISFWYWEPQNSTGHGVRVKNSNGNYEAGIATDNPQFVKDDANGPSRMSTGSASYETWTYAEMSFDWANSEVTFFFDNNSSNTYTGPLKQGIDIETVELWTYSGGTWGAGDYDQENYWDLMKHADVVTSTSAPQNVTTSVSQDDITVDWDEVSSANGYYVYRAQVSGSVLEDYTEIADVTAPPYTDSALEDGEQYNYRVSSHL